MIIVDDTLMLAVLAGTAPADIRSHAEASEVATTGSWYWRLGRAINDPRSDGSLSRAFGALSPAEQQLVFAGIETLPPEIGLLSLRDLVPVMTALQTPRRLNLLAAEVVAAALVLDAAIVVTAESQLLSEACDTHAIELRHISR